MIKVKVLATGDIQDWSMDRILEEVNKDNDGKQYTESDWFYGWYDRVEHEGYYQLIEGVVRL